MDTTPFGSKLLGIRSKLGVTTNAMGKQVGVSGAAVKNHTYDRVEFVGEKE